VVLFQLSGDGIWLTGFSGRRLTAVEFTHAGAGYNSWIRIITRSSATAEKQRVSCTCLYLGWITDPAMHRTPQNRRASVIFDIQTLLFKKCWPKTHFVMKYPLNVIQVHPFCTQLPADNGHISSNNIACRISEVFKDVAT